MLYNLTTLKFRVRHHLKFCQACELAVVGVPEDDEVLPLLPHALEAVHLPHPVVGDPLEDQQAGELVPGQGHLGSLVPLLLLAVVEARLVFGGRCSKRKATLRKRPDTV